MDLEWEEVVALEQDLQEIVYVQSAGIECHIKGESHATSKNVLNVEQQ